MLLEKYPHTDKFTSHYGPDDMTEEGRAKFISLNAKLQEFLAKGWFYGIFHQREVRDLLFEIELIMVNELMEKRNIRLLIETEDEI